MLQHMLQPFCIFQTALCFSRFLQECTRFLSNWLVLLEIPTDGFRIRSKLAILFPVLLPVSFALVCHVDMVGSFVLDMGGPHTLVS